MLADVRLYRRKPQYDLRRDLSKNEAFWVDIREVTKRWENQPTRGENGISMTRFFEVVFSLSVVVIYFSLRKASRTQKVG